MDMDILEIEKLKNAAENGRCFLCMLAFINLLTGNPLLAFIAILPIGFAVVIDRMMPPGLAGVAALVNLLVVVAVTAASLVNLW